MRRYFDDVLIGSIELFCLAAESGSFTIAAQTAGITPAAVSRSIARLEERLGTRLFVRSTRSIRLTDCGKSYYTQSRQGLDQLIEAEQQITGRRELPSGVLRLSLPTTYAHHRILPLLVEFQRIYPEVKIDVHVSNRNVDLIEEGFDAAIRVRVQPDSSLIARHLEDGALVVFASPRYLQEKGTPQTPDDLANHDCIQFELPRDGRCVPWLFHEKGKEREVSTQGNFKVLDDLLAAVTLAKNGAGLLQTYRFIVEKDLADGRLIEVLKPYSGSSRPYTLLYPHGRLIPMRLRVFSDFLVEKLRPN